MPTILAPTSDSEVSTTAVPTQRVRRGVAYKVGGDHERTEDELGGGCTRASSRVSSGGTKIRRVEGWGGALYALSR